MLQRWRVRGPCIICQTSLKSGFFTPPSFFNEKFFNDLYKLAELNNFTAEELRNYMKRLFAVSDYENSIDFAKEESRAEERLKNAKNLKALGVDLDIIAQGLGLDRKTVEEL